MLKPLPETQEALDEYVSLAEPDLDVRIVELGRRAQEVVPEVVGLSLALVREGVTFTLVAPDGAVAVIDAAQYLDGGPCVDAVDDPPDPIETGIDDLLDEGRWALFAQVSAALGVASSLSFSLVDAGRVTGGINVYASTPGAFTGRHEALATALGASALDVVTDADLRFSTREEAVQAPVLLRALQQVDTAVGLLAARFGEDVAQARERLSGASVRAGVSEALVAKVLIQLQSG